MAYFANSISSWPSELLDGCSGAYSLLIPPKAPSSSRYSLPKRKTPTAVPATVRVGGKILELRIITLPHEIVAHELYSIHYRLDFLIPVSSIFNYPCHPTHTRTCNPGLNACRILHPSKLGLRLPRRSPHSSIHDPSCLLIKRIQNRGKLYQAPCHVGGEIIFFHFSNIIKPYLPAEQGEECM